jgi:hypothetical protein
MRARLTKRTTGLQESEQQISGTVFDHTWEAAALAASPFDGSDGARCRQLIFGVAKPPDWELVFELPFLEFCNKQSCVTETARSLR